MNEPFTITLNIAQIVMLGGVIWGLAKMSSSVDTLRGITTGLTTGLEKISDTLADMVTRVTVLEDRTARNIDDRRRQ